MAKVKMDGKVFNFPEGMSKDDMKSALDKYHGQQSGTPDLGLPASAQELPVDQVMQSGAAVISPQAMPTSEVQERSGMSLLESGIDMFTGESKRTPEMDDPNIRQVDFMPEVNSLASLVPGSGAYSTIAGTILNGDPADRAQIYKANFPHLEISTDSKGNFLYKSKDGKTYKDELGFGVTDIPNAIVGAGLGVAEGMLGGASIKGQMLWSAISEIGNEAAQYFAGGAAPDPLNIAATTVLGGAGEIPGAIGRKAKSVIEPKVVRDAATMSGRGAAEEVSQALPEEDLVQLFKKASQGNEAAKKELALNARYD